MTMPSHAPATTTQSVNNLLATAKDLTKGEVLFNNQAAKLMEPVKQFLSDVKEKNVQVRLETTAASFMDFVNDYALANPTAKTDSTVVKQLTTQGETILATLKKEFNEDDNLLKKAIIPSNEQLLKLYQSLVTATPNKSTTITKNAYIDSITYANSLKANLSEPMELVSSAITEVTEKLKTLNGIIATQKPVAALPAKP